MDDLEVCQEKVKPTKTEALGFAEAGHNLDVARYKGNDKSPLLVLP